MVLPLFFSPPRFLLFFLVKQSADYAIVTVAEFFGSLLDFFTGCFVESYELLFFFCHAYITSVRITD